MTTLSFDNTLRSLEFTLRAQRKSNHTIRQYLDSARRFATWLDRDPLTAKRHDVVLWLATLQDAGMAPATVRHKYAGLKAFFKWAREEGLVKKNPMAKVRPPQVPETQKDVVSAPEMGRVLDALDGQAKRLPKGVKKALAARDAALISLLYDSGVRVSELCRMREGQVDWDEAVIVLPATKNGEVRTVPFGPTTAARLQRWLRQKQVKGDHLFTALQGPNAGRPLTRSGVYQLVVRVFRRLEADGVIGPHDLRHTWATHFMEDEQARTDDLMTLGGWRSPQMAARYTKARKVQRAIAAHRRLSPVERLA